LLSLFQDAIFDMKTKHVNRN